MLAKRGVGIYFVALLYVDGDESCGFHFRVEYLGCNWDQEAVYIGIGNVSIGKARLIQDLTFHPAAGERTRLERPSAEQQNKVDT